MPFAKRQNRKATCSRQQVQLCQAWHYSEVTIDPILCVQVQTEKSLAEFSSPEEPTAPRSRAEAEVPPATVRESNGAQAGPTAGQVRFRGGL